MANKTFDAIVIGGGPGGYVAAIRLGQLGQKTLVVEKEYMGGVCLNWGCIPSKALIAAANFYEKLHHADHMGITVTGASIDINKLQDWKDNTVVKKMTSGVTQLVKGAGAETVMGTAKFTSKNTIEVVKTDGTKESFTASKAIIVATGAATINIPTLPIDGEVVITAREAVSLREAKGHMVIVGGGVIGMELGMVYQKLGMKITVVELADQLLGQTDLDLVKVVEKGFTKAGGTVLLKAKAQKLERKGKKAIVTVEVDGKTQDLEADRVLVAIGFKPNSKGLGLEEVGVKLDERGHIAVNDLFQTNVPGIYAIGDVIGMPYLAHKASKEGEIAAEVIAGHKAARDWRAMPSAIFTEPEIATVGMSEREAKSQGREVEIGKFPFAASGRAVAVSATEGFIKTIIDKKTHEVLGVGIVGPEASDLISESALAIEMCAYAEDVALTIHPHPTLGEGVMEAFKHALGEAIHIGNRKVAKPEAGAAAAKH